MEILINIIVNLDFIHYRNILQFYYNDWIDINITDLGLAQLSDNSNSSNSTSVCGVLPYIAPEIINRKPRHIVVLQVIIVLVLLW